MSTYIKMVDNFFSDWGRAAGKTNLYVIECDTQEQADQIKVAAERRPEMDRVRQVAHEPKSNGAILVTLTHYNSLGQVWTS